MEADLVLSLEDLRSHLRRLAQSYSHRALANECNKRMRLDAWSRPLPSTPMVTHDTVRRILGGNQGFAVRYQAVYHVWHTLQSLRSAIPSNAPVGKWCQTTFTYVTPDWTFQRAKTFLEENDFSFAPYKYRRDRRTRYDRLVSRELCLENDAKIDPGAVVGTVVDQVTLTNPCIVRSDTPIGQLLNRNGDVEWKLCLVEEFPGRVKGLLAPYDMDRVARN